MPEIINTMLKSLVVIHLNVQKYIFQEGKSKYAFQNQMTPHKDAGTVY